VALAAAIENLIDDRLLAQKLGKAGYERARELFSIERNVRELCALIL
jgi:glycosyltransferase involved in cell wall biosynthesis